MSTAIFISNIVKDDQVGMTKKNVKIVNLMGVYIWKNKIFQLNIDLHLITIILPSFFWLIQAKICCCMPINL